MVLQTKPPCCATYCLQEKSRRQRLTKRSRSWKEAQHSIPDISAHRLFTFKYRYAVSREVYGCARCSVEHIVHRVRKVNVCVGRVVVDEDERRLFGPVRRQTSTPSGVFGTTGC